MINMRWSKRRNVSYRSEHGRLRLKVHRVDGVAYLGKPQTG
jgi:hypothetical protein